MRTVSEKSLKNVVKRRFAECVELFYRTAGAGNRADNSASMRPIRMTSDDDNDAILPIQQLLGYAINCCVDADTVFECLD